MFRVKRKSTRLKVLSFMFFLFKIRQEDLFHVADTTTLLALMLDAVQTFSL